jgi:excinuclease UvrABC ATPase subunit
LIDLGPEGGQQGGKIVACGSPLEVAQDGKSSHTARFLRAYFNGGAPRAKNHRVLAKMAL